VVTLRVKRRGPRADRRDAGTDGEGVSGGDRGAIALTEDAARPHPGGAVSRGMSPRGPL